VDSFAAYAYTCLIFNTYLVAKKRVDNPRKTTRAKRIFFSGDSGWIHLQHMRMAVALARGNFLLLLSQKTIGNSHVQKRQLYAYAANESPKMYSNTRESKESVRKLSFEC